MKYRDNKVATICDHYHLDLDAEYGRAEVEAFLAVLFRHYLGWNRATLHARRDSLLSESELLHLHFALKALRQHKPLQYILGETEFYGLTFKVNENVLIPRPETEELVELVLKEMEDRASVLDIGTGSGCIAVALKKNRPDAEVTAIDVSAAALEIARENATLHETEIEFIEADITQSLRDSRFDKRFTHIVSNPPYILRSEATTLQANVRNHEPHLALFVEEDPLYFYRFIAEFAAQKLVPGGKLYFETHTAYAQEVADLLNAEGFTQVRVYKDLQDRPRMVKAVK